MFFLTLMLIGVWTSVFLIKQSLHQLRRSVKKSEISTCEKPLLQVWDYHKQSSARMSNISSTNEISTQDLGDTIDCSTIEFSSCDEEFCKEITTLTTTIISSAGKHDHGSSRVKLKNFVDYKWEVKHFPGHLIAVHMNGNYVAYVINVGAKGGMVRVVEAQTGLRALIKGMNGEVLDLQFAHIANECLLASIDMQSLFVHRIEKADNSNLNCVMMLKIEDPLSNYTPSYDKVSWCPFIGTNNDHEVSRLIVWTRDNMFQCFDIDNIINDDDSINVFNPNDIKEGYLKFQDTKLKITWVAFSPDGSTLSVGSQEGFIRFYQVYMYDQQPRCLHQWNPHNGKPISSFFFLDDLNKCKADAFWKFAITGANNNTEFKLWDCVDWSCMQTIKIKNTTSINTRFLAEIDPTSSFLVISSLDLRVCYVMQIAYGNNINLLGGLNSDNDKMSKLHKLPVYVKSIAEFPLHSGILSFSIVDATSKICKNGNDNYADEDLEVEDFDDDLHNTLYSSVALHMFIVQPKSMQECRICYRPPNHENFDEATALENLKDAEEYEDDMDSSSLDLYVSTVDAGNMSTSSTCNNDSSATTITPPTVRSTSTASKLSETVSPQPLASDIKLQQQKQADQDVNSDVLNTILLLASVTGNTMGGTPKGENINLLNLVNNKMIEDQEHKKLQLKQSVEQEIKPFVAIDNHPERHVLEHVPSGSSSPSREVQEIMSLNQSYSSSNDMIDVKVISTNNNDDDVETPNANNWPSAPNLTKTTKFSTSTSSAELQNAANLLPQAVQSYSSSITTTTTTATSSVNSIKCSNNYNNIKKSRTNKNSELDEINNKMTQLMELMKIQTMKISSLHEEIQELKKVKTCDAKNMSEFSFKIEMQLSKLMEQYLKRYENEHKKKLTAFMTGREVQNRELRDSILQMINQYVLTQFGDLASKVIIFEIQRQLVPLINSKIDNLQQQLQVNVTQKFNAFDIMIKENIAQICKSKSIIETFGKSVMAGAQGSLQAAFIESMSGTLIPAYEKASQNMFQQLHEAFALGIKEFMDQFEVYLQHLKPINDNAEQIAHSVHNFRQALEENVVSQHRIVSEALSESRNDVKSIEISLSRQISDTIRMELKKCFDHQNTSIRSQASTPAPVYDMRDAIRQLLQQGQINRAFHQALLADDLNLVEFTLKTADHNTVFTPICCLEQKVLLSLINQIAADMTNHNEIKQNYLTEALLAINPIDPITREHAPKVLQELFRNCQKFLINFPKSPQCSNVRMLMKGVQAYIEQF